MSLPRPSFPFRAGAARVNITPTEPIWLGGYASRDRPSQGVISELFVRALVLETVHSDAMEPERSVIISVDQVGIARELSQAITARLAERFGLARERVLLAYSHTHSGPVCDRGLQVVYPMDGEQWAVVDRYAAYLLERTETAVAEALAALEPVELFFSSGVAGFGVNRRRIRPGCAHFPAPVDHDVPVLHAVSASGALKAIVYGYACHTTTLGFNQISADYAGFTSEELETAYPHAVALYVAGCGADINPLPRHSVALARHYGAILAAAVSEAIISPRRIALTEAPAIAYEEISLPFEVLPTLEEWEQDAAGEEIYRRRWAQLWLEKIRQGEPIPGHLVYPIQVWRFGNALTWVALSAEVCVDYSLRLKALLGLGKTWVSAYAHEINGGYIPSRRLLEEGGYEGGDSGIYFSLPARRYGREVEETLVAAVERLAASLCPSIG